LETALIFVGAGPWACPGPYGWPNNKNINRGQPHGVALTGCGRRGRLKQPSAFVCNSLSAKHFSTRIRVSNPEPGLQRRRTPRQGGTTTERIPALLKVGASCISFQRNEPPDSSGACGFAGRRMRGTSLRLGGFIVFRTSGIWGRGCLSKGGYRSNGYYACMDDGACIGGQSLHYWNRVCRRVRRAHQQAIIAPFRLSPRGKRDVNHRAGHRPAPTSAAEGGRESEGANWPRTLCRI